MTQSLETNPHTYCQSLTREGRIYNGKRQSLPQWCWESRTATCKSTKLEHSLTPYTKINSKQFTYLNIRHNTIKLEENIGKTFTDINCTDVFLGQSPKAVEIKAKINGTQSNTSFCTPKETTKKKKDSLQDGRKYLQTMQPIRA